MDGTARTMVFPFQAYGKFLAVLCVATFIAGSIGNLLYALNHKAADHFDPVVAHRIDAKIIPPDTITIAEAPEVIRDKQPPAGRLQYGAIKDLIERGAGADVVRTHNHPDPILEWALQYPNGAFMEADRQRYFCIPQLDAENSIMGRTCRSFR